MLENTILGNLIKNARTHQNMTQEELAVKLFVTKQAVSNWERGINRPDEEMREKLESLLDVKLSGYSVGREKQNMNIPRLNSINDIDSLLAYVDTILDKIEVDGAFAVSLKQLLRLVFIQVLGFDCYYRTLQNFYSECPLDWDSVAEDLDSIVSKGDIYPIRENAAYPFTSGNMMLQKIEWVSFVIGGELFEDFDEDGYRNGFMQKIGNLGEAAGHELLNILPDKDNALSTAFKAAVLRLAEYLDSLAEPGGE